MTLRKIFIHTTFIMAATAVAAAIHSCARMGSPDGGWYDDTPPRVVAATPADRSVNASSKRLTIAFNEFIKLDDPVNKVVVSPPQLEAPEIKTAGKKIVIDLLDSLKENTTYTVDFSDAISDNNENNPMGNFTYSFSTGETIDTFEVAGTVLDASNLEPVKDILVGLYDNLSDTALTTLPMQRVSRTNGSGRFVIKGVAPGDYRIYALKDMDGNYMLSQKSETMAFRPDIYTPSSAPDIRQDTIWRDSLRIDSIILTHYTHFYPDNVVLLAFTQPQTDRYLLKTERVQPERIDMYFTYGDDSLPQLRGIDFDATDAFVVEPSEHNDTIMYWIKDTLLANRDTLTLEMTYMATDTTGLLVSRTDTIPCIPKQSYEKRKKQAEREYEKWKNEQEKRKKKGQDYDSIMPRKPLDLDIKVPSMMSPEQNITLSMPAPLSHLDTAAVHLYAKHDTLWYRSRCRLIPVEGSLRQFECRAEWRPGIEYSLEIDSAAFEDIYGNVSDPVKKGIRIAGNDQFGSLFVNISGAEDSTLVVQLLNTSDTPTRNVRVKDGTAEFYYMRGGKYYLRAFVDSNGNGIWDTGDYASGQQPEDVYYYPKAIECKAKWDITTTWNITATPRDKQKPIEITKQKPDKQKTRRNRNADRARDLGIEYKGGTIK